MQKLRKKLAKKNWRRVRKQMPQTQANEQTFSITIQAHIRDAGFDEANQRCRCENGLDKELSTYQDDILTNAGNLRLTMKSACSHKRNLAGSQDRASSRHPDRRNRQPTILRFRTPTGTDVTGIYIYERLCASDPRFPLILLWCAVCTILAGVKGMVCSIAVGATLAQNGMSGNAGPSAADSRFQSDILSSFTVCLYLIMSSCHAYQESSKQVFAADEECQAWRCHVLPSCRIRESQEAIRIVAIDSIQSTLP